MPNDRLVTADTLAAALAEIMDPPGWSVLGERRTVRAQTAYRNASLVILAAIPPDPRLDALLAALGRLWYFYGPLETYDDGERGMTQLDHGHEAYGALMDVRAASDALAAFEAKL